MGRGKQPRQGPLTSEAIVDAALEVARAVGGYPTVRAVAERLGCAPSTLYAHFQTQGEIDELMLLRLLSRVKRLPSYDEASYDERDWFESPHLTVLDPQSGSLSGAPILLEKVRELAPKAVALVRDLVKKWALELRAELRAHRLLGPQANALLPGLDDADERLRRLLVLLTRLAHARHATRTGESDKDQHFIDDQVYRERLLETGQRAKLIWMVVLAPESRPESGEETDSEAAERDRVETRRRLAIILAGLGPDQELTAAILREKVYHEIRTGKSEAAVLLYERLNEIDATDHTRTLLSRVAPQVSRHKFARLVGRSTLTEDEVAGIVANGRLAKERLADLEELDFLLHLRRRAKDQAALMRLWERAKSIAASPATDATE